MAEINLRIVQRLANRAEPASPRLKSANALERRQQATTSATGPGRRTRMVGISEPRQANPPRSILET